MFYVGLDIHTKRIAFCVLSDKGQLVQRGQVRGLDEVLRVLPDPLHHTTATPALEPAVDCGVVAEVLGGRSPCNSAYPWAYRTPLTLLGKLSRGIGRQC